MAYLKMPRFLQRVRPYKRQYYCLFLTIPPPGFGLTIGIMYTTMRQQKT